MLNATQYPLLDIFWSILEVFLFVIWIFLLFTVILDVFRSHDVSGWAKALWLLFVIILPFLGVLVYLIARGSSMHERSVRQAQQQEQAFRSYVKSVSGGGTDQTEELRKLGELRDKGVLTQEEFDQQKAKILG